MRNRYKKYLKYIEVTKSNNTLISYKKALRRFPNGTPEEIMQLIADDKLSDGTKKLCLTIFKQAEKFYGYWNQDLAILVDGWKPNESVQPCPTAEEVANMLQHLRATNQRVAFMLMTYNGLRVSEVANLRVDDVDLDKRIVKLIGTKGKRDAFIPIANPILYDLLTKQLENRSHGMTVCSLCVGSLMNMVHRVAKKCGYPYHAHSLRRYFANTLKHSNVAIEDIQTLMRHRSIETTRRYLNIDVEDSRNVLEGVAF